MKIATAFGAVLLCAATFASAQVKWPEYSTPLAPGANTSPVQAALPPDTNIQAPDANLPPNRSRWSGKWSGWACSGSVCSTRMAVEKVGPDGASFVYVFGSSAVKPNPQRVEGKFIGEELHGTLASGSKVAYRWRSDNAIELVFIATNGNVVSGVLTKE